MAQNNSVNVWVCCGQIGHVRSSFAAAYHHHGLAAIELLACFEP